MNSEYSFQHYFPKLSAYLFDLGFQDHLSDFVVEIEKRQMKNKEIKDSFRFCLKGILEEMEFNFEIESYVPEWAGIRAHSNGRTNVHTLKALISLFLDNSFLSADKNDQNIILWTILLHDLEKKPEAGKGKDWMHPFKSAATAIKVFIRMGFWPTSAASEKLCEVLQSASIMGTSPSGNPRSVPDHSKLPYIIEKIDQLSRSPFCTYVIKAILFHQSFSPLQEYPNAKPLTEEDCVLYLDVDVLYYLEIVMANDSASYSILDNQKRLQLLKKVSSNVHKKKYDILNHPTRTTAKPFDLTRRLPLFLKKFEEQPLGFSKDAANQVEIFVQDILSDLDIALEFSSVVTEWECSFTREAKTRIIKSVLTLTRMDLYEKLYPEYRDCVLWAIIARELANASLQDRSIPSKWIIIKEAIRLFFRLGFISRSYLHEVQYISDYLTEVDKNLRPDYQGFEGKLVAALDYLNAFNYTFMIAPVRNVMYILAVHDLMSRQLSKLTLFRYPECFYEITGVTFEMVECYDAAVSLSCYLDNLDTLFTKVEETHQRFQSNQEVILSVLDRSTEVGEGDLPGFDQTFPDLTKMLMKYAEDFSTEREMTFDQLRDDMQAILKTESVAKRITEIMPEMDELTQHCDGDISMHTLTVMLSFFKDLSFEGLDPVTRDIVTWALFLHDVMKRPQMGKGKDFVHPFKGAARACLILFRLGIIPRTSENYQMTRKFSSTLHQGYKLLQKRGVSIPVQNHRCLHQAWEILEYMPTQARMILKLILLHQSVTVVLDSPQAVDLTREERASFLDPLFIEVFQHIMLHDSVSYCLLHPPKYEAYYHEISEKLYSIKKELRKGAGRSMTTPL